MNTQQLTHRINSQTRTAMYTCTEKIHSAKRTI